ncbi:hypothetical protein K8I28_10645 [bacterium]|nr:hypothetical protein [bacterium]
MRTIALIGMALLIASASFAADAMTDVYLEIEPYITVAAPVDYVDFTLNAAGEDGTPWVDGESSTFTVECNDDFDWYFTNTAAWTGVYFQYNSADTGTEFYVDHAGNIDITVDLEAGLVDPANWEGTEWTSSTDAGDLTITVTTVH